MIQMTTLKSLIIATALLASGASLAIAQNGPATGGEPPVGGGAKGNPAFQPYGGPYLRSAAPVESAAPAHSYTARHHKRIYMTTRHHQNGY
jgi:hypothetical protein